ncbi:MAG TPA: response regulator [Candidatus Eisenbacteria bacterium]|nr:response regulator [Candidatus Eisenbacteria bacterium]
MKTAAETRVLVVEDDTFFQRVLHKRLAAEGYQVYAANDGREGMKAIVSFEPDLVISDWMMPEVDGLELCQSVKTGLGDSAPYFILLTAKGEISNRLLALDTGADDYLVKPCDQGELMARVRAGLRIVLLTQELRHTVDDLKRANEDLQTTREQVVRLEQELLPICAFCKKVRDAAGEWIELEDYLHARAVDVTHGVCPTCRITHYPAIAPDRRTG